MHEPDWIETKKECDVDPAGKLTVRRVTLERKKSKSFGLERKDIIDIAIRLISLGAIFIPLFLFYKQQKAERDKQKTFFQLELYSNSTTQLNSLVNQPLGSTAFDQTRSKLLYEIYPKLRLLSDDVVIDSFLVLKDIIDYAAIMSRAFNSADSLKKHVSAFATSPSNRADITAQDRLMESIGGSVQTLTGTQKEILNWKGETLQGQQFTRESQQKAARLFAVLSRDTDAVLEAINAGTYENDSKSSRAGSRIDGINSGLAGSASLEQFYSTIAMIQSLKSSYSSRFNIQTQTYTSKLDSIMAESAKTLYSK